MCRMKARTRLLQRLPSRALAQGSLSVPFPASAPPGGVHASIAWTRSLAPQIAISVFCLVPVFLVCDRRAKERRRAEIAKRAGSGCRSACLRAPAQSGGR